MLKFLFGVGVSALLFVVLSSRPELLRHGVSVAREHIGTVAQRVSEVANDASIGESSDDRPAAAQSVQIDVRRARALRSGMSELSRDELWAVMDDSDYDRRAAAAGILLERATIPASAQGIDTVRTRYFRSGKTADLQNGFSYLGLLALQGVPEELLIEQSQRFVERYPRHEACDYALWALGELGSEELIPYFFSIIEDPRRYGPAARERAFCCLAQCGRYTPDQRLRMVPRFIEIHKAAADSETRGWCMQALAHCAPGVRAGSIRDWTAWWARR